MHGMGQLTPPLAMGILREARGLPARTQPLRRQLQRRASLVVINARQIRSQPLARVAEGLLPHIGAVHLLRIRARREWSSMVARQARIAIYRLALLSATFLLAWALLWLQDRLGAVPLHPTLWQRGVQWAEVIWLVPVPLALALWIGWFVFAVAALPDPAAISAPPIVSGRRASPPVRLIFRFVTRGDYVDVLRESVNAVHAAFASYSETPGPYHVEIVTERPIAPQSSAECVFVVPARYTTPHGSLYKARALAYLQETVVPERGDWFVYLDEESVMGPGMLAGIYRFIRRTQQDQRSGRTPRVIGQGGILYQGGHWFYRGADALRTADDLGRFRLQYAFGVPLFGIHGSYVIVRGEDDARLSFDVGPTNSITEDAAWALRAWARGYRFGWVEGFLHEQPPQRISDFVRQRARWLSGIRLVLRDHTIPRRYRVCLGLFTFFWQISFLPFLVAVAALFAHIAPFAWMRLPADFGWASFVLAYVQGAHVQSSRWQPHKTTATPWPANRPQWLAAPARAMLTALLTLVAYLAAWGMALCYIWYALLEALGVLYSLMPGRGFFVISKPKLSVKPAEMESEPAPPEQAAREMVSR